MSENQLIFLINQPGRFVGTAAATNRAVFFKHQETITAIVRSRFPIKTKPFSVEHLGNQARVITGRFHRCGGGLSNWPSMRLPNQNTTGQKRNNCDARRNQPPLRLFSSFRFSHPRQCGNNNSLATLRAGDGRAARCVRCQRVSALRTIEFDIAHGMSFVRASKIRLGYCLNCITNCQRQNKCHINRGVRQNPSNATRYEPSQKGQS